MTYQYVWGLHNQVLGRSTDLKDAELYIKLASTNSHNQYWVDRRPVGAWQRVNEVGEWVDAPGVLHP